MGSHLWRSGGGYTCVTGAAYAGGECSHRTLPHLFSLDPLHSLPCSIQAGTPDTPTLIFPCPPSIFSPAVFWQARSTSRHRRGPRQREPQAPKCRLLLYHQAPKRS